MAWHAPEGDDKGRGGERQRAHEDGDHAERQLRSSAKAMDQNEGEGWG